jgi:hypothetical protein
MRKYIYIGFSVWKDKVIFSDEKVNVFSTKSTNPGKGATKAGKQTTGSER